MDGKAGLVTGAASGIGRACSLRLSHESNATPERQQEIMRPQAMSQFGDPGEVAAAVAWLCSDDASFVTGAAVPVDACSVAGW